jgi:hypothetical protein
MTNTTEHTQDEINALNLRIAKAGGWRIVRDDIGELERYLLLSPDGVSELGFHFEFAWADKAFAQFAPDYYRDLNAVFAACEVVEKKYRTRLFYSVGRKHFSKRVRGFSATVTTDHSIGDTAWCTALQPAAALALALAEWLDKQDGISE